MGADGVRQLHIVTVAAFSQGRRRQMVVTAPLITLGAAGFSLRYGHFILKVKQNLKLELPKQAEVKLEA